MGLKFNLDRPKPGDDEIRQGQDFNALVEQFKKQSLKKARGDESWRRSKAVRYTAVIAGVTVVCTVTLLSLLNKPTSKQTEHETIITQKNTTKVSPSKKFISAPSGKIKVGYASYKVNNDKGGNIVHHTNTKIRIPAKSFTYKNGEDVVGEVTIQYREFHDEGDIIAGGIPMRYDSAGTHYNLETAGMFEILGEQNGAPVFIKKEKALSVELVSASNENRFNQYFLDTIARNWTYLKKDQPVAFTKKAAEKSIPSAKMRAAEQLVNHVIPARIDSVRNIFEQKIAKIPVVKEPARPAKSTTGRPTFKFEGSYEEFPELSAFDNVVFEVGPENKNYSPELHEITWSDVKISQGPVKGKNYLLDLSYRNRHERLVVYPVLTGRDYEFAKNRYEKQLEEYHSLLEKKKAEERRMMAEMEARQAEYMALQKKKQAELADERAKIAATSNADELNELATEFNRMSNPVRATRLFSVNRFGIYNSDCPHKVPGGNAIIPQFVNNGKMLGGNAAYLVDHTAKSVYQLSGENQMRMSIDPASEYSICLFNGNRIYLCSRERFRNTRDNNSDRFELELLKDEDNDLTGLKKALEL
jgi:hypothetical protein